jgi:hypothetical protein
LSTWSGCRAQAPFPPYYGLWSRLGGFRPEDLAPLNTDRGVVRIALMRGTIHLVSARDCLPLVQEAARILAFCAPGAPHDIRFSPVA